MQKINHLIIYILAAIAAAIFLLVAVPKVLFPYEAHWMEGAMLAEVSWLLGGHALYTAPSIYHVPSLYQPLYYYITTAIASVTGLSYFTARIPSILATSMTIGFIYYVVRRETSKTVLAIAAIGLFIAAFGKTEYGFLTARIDPLVTALILAASVAIYYSKSYRGLFFGALLFALGFFTKQSAMVFVPAIVIYLLVIRDWKQALLFSLSFIGIIAIGIFSMNFVSDGWYSFYTYSIISAMAKSPRWDYALHGLLAYIILRCWVVAIPLLFLPLRSFVLRSQVNRHRSSVFFGLMFAASILAGYLGILNPGGGHNVLLPAAVFGAIFLPLIVDELSSKRFGAIIRWLIPIQLLFLLSYPFGDSRNSVGSSDKENYKKFYSYVSSLPGEVWIPYHSFTETFTGKREYAGYDFLDGARMPDDKRASAFRNDIDTAFAARHWNFILSDFKQVFPYYRLSTTTVNLNKMHGSDDTLLYIYEPATK
ncbi:MAG: glycosyltransferase family 39 protein [Bacteroidota bacterium]|nr:glycosyltransferase family 39 protein [Bacteroidota bacterium]MDP4230644.1 glycosyltransferase family 39 protein [Bacteroidota bacterium]MDP4236778.1 glycosyltransferase family 39 protein [Bacteroidota bacterium]